MPTRTIPAALLAATALLLAACTSASPHSNPQTNPKIGITTHSTVTADDTVVQVNNWWTGGGKTKLNAITTDLGKISHDGHDVTAINTDCGTLSTDVTTALTYKPIPDQQAQQHWASALSDFQQAATNCQGGATTLDTSLINQAGADLKAGTAEFNAVTTRLSQLVASS